LQHQTPQYLKSEELELGYFVAVGFRDDDFAPKHIDRVRRVAERVSQETGKVIQAAFIDARPKLSASKLWGERPEEEVA
jgi:hypothetical protein